MKTAIEWLVEEITNGTLHTKKLIEQAKEMEKQQLNDAYNSDRPNLCAFTEGTAFKEYYKETFKP